MMKIRVHKVDYFSCLGLLFLFIDAVTVITYQILELSIVFLKCTQTLCLCDKFHKRVYLIMPEITDEPASIVL